MMEKKAKNKKTQTSDQMMDTPLAGAAFTHLIAFAKKAGTIVTRDLLPRRDGSNHFNTCDVLLTGDKLGGKKPQKKQTK